MTFYFAYGSNMDGRQMAARVPSARFVGTAVLPGHEFIFSGWSVTRQGSVANVRKKAGSKVFGVVYELSDSGLRLLDQFEGYPMSYYRRRVRVELLDAPRRVTAELYYKKKTRPDGPPNPAYVEQILRALRQRGLS